ncbi:MAG: hypothetical protein ACOCXM_10935 [Myxococcota bacterium]
MFEHTCGESSGCAAMIVLSGLLVAVAGVCWLVIVVRAFRHDSRLQGALNLLIPPYVLYYAIARLEPPRKALLITGLVAGPILALVAWNSATAVFGPNVAEQPAAQDDAFADDEELGDWDEPLE